MNEATRNKWDLRFLTLAEHVAGWSKDPSTKVGAVLSQGKHVVGLGYNGFPKGTEDSEELYRNRPKKLLRIVHAEINALADAEHRRTDTELTISIWPLPACCSCAGALINFGVTRVVISASGIQLAKDRWKESCEEALFMFQEAGIPVIEIDGV